MTLLSKGKLVACDVGCCADAFRGSRAEAQVVGWSRRGDADACPACSEEIRKILAPQPSRIEESRAAAHRLADLIALAGGPSARVWGHEKTGIRVYLPGGAGYLSVSGLSAFEVSRGKQTFYPTALYPAWARAVAKARKKFREESKR